MSYDILSIERLFEIKDCCWPFFLPSPCELKNSLICSNENKNISIFLFPSEFHKLIKLVSRKLWLPQTKYELVQSFTIGTIQFCSFSEKDSKHWKYWTHQKDVTQVDYYIRLQDQNEALYYTILVTVTRALWPTIRGPSKVSLPNINTTTIPKQRRSYNTGKIWNYSFWKSFNCYFA